MFDLDAMDQADRKLRELAPKPDCALGPVPARIIAEAPRGCPLQHREAAR